MSSFKVTKARSSTCPAEARRQSLSDTAGSGGGLRGVLGQGGARSASAPSEQRPYIAPGSPWENGFISEALKRAAYRLPRPGVLRLAAR